MSTITSSYRTNNIELFFNDFSTNNANTANPTNEYYFFLSTIDSSSYSNTEYDKNKFLEKTIFGKKISNSQIFYLVKNNRWLPDTVYDQYDDQVDNSIKNNFFIVVYPEDDNSTPNYQVYKCLFNNYGAKSKVLPSSGLLVNGGIQQTNDGYKWKHLYEIEPADFKKYSVAGFVPVTSDLTTMSNTSNIDVIAVENNLENNGYEKVSGDIIEVFDINVIINSPDLKATHNYYIGQSLYVTNTTSNVSRLYEIASYDYNISKKQGTLTLINKDNFIDTQSSSYTYSIFPRIAIEGDGAGAVGIPHFSTTQPNNINRIDMISNGSGYTNAIAYVVPPLFFDQISNTNNKSAVLRPILSPKGGHGAEPKSELLSNHALLYSGITNQDNLTIPTTNTYSSIGLVKNPVFTSNTSPEVFDNRIKITLDTNPLNIDDIVTQNNGSEITFSARVHETLNNDVYLVEYMGPYQNNQPSANTGYSDISLNQYLEIITPKNNQLIIIKNDINTNEPLTIVSPYVQKSGEVFYMASFSQITRTSSSYEEYKIILQF